MFVRRRIAGAMLALAALSLLPVSGAPARAAAAQDDLPTVTSVGHSFPPPPATVRGDGTVLVRIPWKATPGSEGICSFSIYTYDATTGVQLGSHHSAPGSARYFDVHLDPLRTDPSPSVYAIAVYPIDCVGDMGIGQVTNPFVVKNVYEGGVSRSGPNWSYKATTGAIGNRILVNSTKGSSFSIHTCYTNFAWIAQKNPQGGTASVKVDGVPLTTVNLYSATVKQRQLVAKTFDVGNGCHTVTVTNTSTTARKQLNVDAIFIQSE